MAQIFWGIGYFRHIADFVRLLSGVPAGDCTDCKRITNRGAISWNDVNHSVQSWIGHIQHADTYGLRRSLFSDIIFRRS